MLPLQSSCRNYAKYDQVRKNMFSFAIQKHICELRVTCVAVRYSSSMTIVESEEGSFFQLQCILPDISERSLAAAGLSETKNLVMSFEKLREEVRQSDTEVPTMTSICIPCIHQDYRRTQTREFARKSPLENRLP